MISRVIRVLYSIKQKRNRNNLKKMVVNSNRNILQLQGVYDARKYDFSLSESQAYAFPKNDYREYINTWEAYQPRLDNNKYSILSDDKLLFSAVMKNYVDVPEVYALIRDGVVHSVCEKELTNADLYDFFLQNNGGVIKARGGYNGFDVYVFLVQDNTLLRNGMPVSREEFAEIISKAKNSLIQSRVEQGAFENSLYDKSVNTIRIISIKKEGALEHEIVAAAQRIGTLRTNAVDNFSQGGLSALIDVELGKLSKATIIDAVDENGNRQFFSKHPDTGAQIEGQIIPNWEQAKAAIIDITRRLPLFHYIAWDIVIKDDGIAVIETNMKSALTVFQVHGGMRHQLLGQKYIEHGYIKEDSK